MDDKNSHWDEIVKLVKENQQSSPIETLDTERMTQMQSKVFAQIDHQFDATNDGREDSGIETKIHSGNRLRSKESTLRNWWQSIFDLPKLPAMAFVALSIITAGLLLNVNRNITEPYFNVPSSLTNAKLDSYIEAANIGSRALASSSTSRRIAFVAGTIQADLDISNPPDNTVVSNLATYFPDLADDPVDATKIIQAFDYEVKDITANSALSLWFKEGYFVEMIHLAAKHALATFEVEPLQDALQNFNDQVDLKTAITSASDVNKSYMENRQQLIEQTGRQLGEPKHFQQIVDLTGAMQVIAR